MAYPGMLKSFLTCKSCGKGADISTPHTGFVTCKPHVHLEIENMHRYIRTTRSFKITSRRMEIHKELLWKARRKSSTNP